MLCARKGEKIRKIEWAKTGGRQCVEETEEGSLGGGEEDSLTLRRRIKSHLLFAGIIRSSPFSPR